MCHDFDSVYWINTLGCNVHKGATTFNVLKLQKWKQNIIQDCASLSHPQIHLQRIWIVSRWPCSIAHDSLKHIVFFTLASPPLSQSIGRIRFRGLLCIFIKPSPLVFIFYAAWQRITVEDVVAVVVRRLKKVYGKRQNNSNVFVLFEFQSM